MGIYDNYFFENVMEKGVNIYLSNKITNFNQQNNVYSCKIQGTKEYEITLKINNDKIEECSCTCPFYKEVDNCKHIYALLLKVKCNYDFNNLPNYINKEIKKNKKNI